MKIIDVPQGSDLWWEAKAGYPSASDFDRILAAASRRPSESQDKYIAELIEGLKNPSAPYFTGQGKPVNAAIQNGIDCEPEARKWYAFERGVRVKQHGFILHDCGKFGCSPDGAIGDVGGLELKCPMEHTHLKYLAKGVLPNHYRCQVHGQLLVTNWQWVDFMSYCVGHPPLLIRVEPDDFTLALAEELYRFLDKYEAAMTKAGIKPRWAA